MSKRKYEYVHHDKQIRDLIPEFIEQHPEFADKKELVYSIISFQFRYAAHRIKLGAYETIRLPIIGSFVPNTALLVEKDHYYGTVSRRKLQLNNKPFSEKNPRIKKDMDQGSRSEEA